MITLAGGQYEGTEFLGIKQGGRLPHPSFAVQKPPSPRRRLRLEGYAIPPSFSLKRPSPAGVSKAKELSLEVE